MPVGPTCPNCARHVPLARTQLHLGKPFSCTGCETQLVVPRSSSAFLAFGLFTAFWLFRDDFPGQWGGPIGLFALIILIGAPLTWVMTAVRRAETP